MDPRRHGGEKVWQLLLFARGNLFNALKHATGAARDRICSIRPGSRAQSRFFSPQSKVKPALLMPPELKKGNFCNKTLIYIFLKKKTYILN